MNAKLCLEIASAVIGGLCIFLLGMKNMSEGMQAVAGARMRKMISAITDNRLLACGTGTAVTALIQSSSVTTVMLVGLVNAGLMSLKQAIGVVLGADLGTTITAWIVSLNILEYGLPVLGISGFFYLFSKNERLRYTAMTIMGIGMVFFGLLVMKTGLHPLRESERFIAMFSAFNPETYMGIFKCITVGTLVTAIVQSSSATIAITIMLAREGVIEYDTAVALALGQNIGTTITAYLASLGTSTNAKRVAYAHIITKIIAVLLMIPIFFGYIKFLNNLLGEQIDIAKRIAFAHSMFNLIIVIMFLPLITPLTKFLHWLIPDKPHKEEPHLTFLNIRLLDTPAFGIQQSADEILSMSNIVGEMLSKLRDTVLNPTPDENAEKQIFHSEQMLDTMQKEIVQFLGGLLSGSIPHDVMNDARKQLRMADEYESISDYITNILKLNLRMRNASLVFSEEGKNDMYALHDRVSTYVTMINKAVKENNPDILSMANAEGDSITHIMKDYRQDHITRIEKKYVDPLNNLVFCDMLTAYRRIKDHALNIAEVLAGEK